MHFDPKPVILAGTQVRLEPLSAEHLNDLFEAGKDPGQGSTDTALSAEI